MYSHWNKLIEFIMTIRFPQWNFKLVSFRGNEVLMLFELLNYPSITYKNTLSDLRKQIPLKRKQNGKLCLYCVRSWVRSHGVMANFPTKHVYYLLLQIIWSIIYCFCCLCSIFIPLNCWMRMMKSLCLPSLSNWPIDSPPLCPGLHGLRIASLNTYYNMKAISLHYNITGQLSD